MLFQRKQSEIGVYVPLLSQSVVNYQ